MEAYQAYKDSLHNLYVWDLFLEDIRFFILEDENLNIFLNEYPYTGNWIETTLSLLLEDSLDEKMLDYDFLRRKYNMQSFYLQIISMSNTLIKDIVNISLERSHESLFSPPKVDWFEEILYEIKQAQKKIKLFILDEPTLMKKIKGWTPSLSINPSVSIVTKAPLIKKVDYFDPTIYKVILKNPSLLKTMDWRLFEEMLADILRRFKYEVELTKPTKDGGIDIIAIKNVDNFGAHKYLLQAKRYNQSVQVSPVRELLFLHDEHKVTKSCLATTAAFTKGAWQLAEQHRWKLELKDQKGILSWISEVVNLNNPL